MRGKVGDVEAKLYELIWKRTMASQMADARGFRTTVQIGDGSALFQASGKTIEFPGFLRAYVEGADDPSAELADKEIVLPPLEEGEVVDARALDTREHRTQPPARYTEASLVKELEARGIGRPSTYASIMETIQAREYVHKSGNALVPSFVAFAVVQLMEQHFESLVDTAFTARMEDDLDAIARGEREAVPYLRDFYFGDQGLQKLLKAEIDARQVCSLPVGENENGETVFIRVGRYGPYVECGEDRATIPESVEPDELDLEKALELLRTGSGPQQLGSDPASGKPVYAKSGRFGPYVQLGDADEDEKPKMKSLLPGMSLDTLTLEEALELLALPRELGVHPTMEAPVFADYGRFGPYVKCGSETRSLKDGDDVRSVTLERAMELLAEEKRARRGPEPIKALGESPETSETIQLMKGRYGPYVTDGVTNASLPRGMAPEEITLEGAIELLRERAARGPARKARRKKAKKKPAKKKTTKKAASKKKASKKKASKKKTAKKTL